MSARTWTLPNGVELRIVDRASVEIQFSAGRGWVKLLDDARDGQALAEILRIELAPERRR